MSVSKTIKERISDALVTAFTFVAALAWRDTLVKILDKYLPGNSDSLASEIIVTLFITLIAAVMIYVVVRADKTVSDYIPIDEDDSEKQS